MRNFIKSVLIIIILVSLYSCAKEGRVLDIEIEEISYIDELNGVTIIPYTVINNSDMNIIAEIHFIIDGEIFKEWTRDCKSYLANTEYNDHINVNGEVYSIKRIKIKPCE